MSIASGYGPNWTTAEGRAVDLQKRVVELEQQLAAALAKARALRALVTEFADELERRLAAIAPQPAERESGQEGRG